MEFSETKGLPSTAIMVLGIGIKTMVSEISETTSGVNEQNGLEHFSKAKFWVKMVSEISEAIGPESQTAHDLPDNLQNLHLPFLSNNLVSEISETSLNQNYGFIKFPEKTKMYKTHKKENCWKHGCNQQWMRILIFLSS